LYSFTDKLKTRFYILDVKNNILTELNYYVYLDEYNKATNVKKFQRQLYYFAAKYKTEDDGLQARINRAEYNQSALIDVIGRINGTTGQTPIAQGLKPSLRYFVGAGYKYNRLVFAGRADLLAEGHKKGSSSPAIAAGIDYVINQQTQRVILRAELVYSSGSYNFLRSAKTDYEDASLSFKQHDIALVPQVVYNFYSTNNFSAFLSAGLAVHFSSYSDNNYTVYDSTFGNRDYLEKLVAFGYLDILGRLIVFPGWEIVPCGINGNRLISMHKVLGNHFIPGALPLRANQLCIF